MESTYTAATHEYDDEGFKPASCARNPNHTDEEDHTEDILNAREVNSKNGAKFCRLQTQRVSYKYKDRIMCSRAALRLILPSRH